MNTLSYRKANAADMDWAYQLFKKGLQTYIDRTWGWNELFQHHSFMENIPPTHFTIVSAAGQDVGGYFLKPFESHLYLDMLLIKPEHQNCGYGTQIIRHLQQRANQQQLPIKLSVLKVNPALRFYHRLEFVVESEDEFRYRLCYHPASL